MYNHSSGSVKLKNKKAKFWVLYLHNQERRLCFTDFQCEEGLAFEILDFIFGTGKKYESIIATKSENTFWSYFKTLQQVKLLMSVFLEKRDEYRKKKNSAKEENKK